jgi:hypothetical protein
MSTFERLWSLSKKPLFASAVSILAATPARCSGGCSANQKEKPEPSSMARSCMGNMKLKLRFA